MKTKKKKRMVLILLILFVLMIVWIIWTNTHITITRIEIVNQKIPAAFNGYKIAEVADLHNHPWGETLIGKIRAEQPDIIAVTGDLVDSSHPNIEVAMAFIKEALTIAPVYYVTGNHEARLPNYRELAECLKKAGVRMMDDQSRRIIKNGAEIQILGIQDPDFVERENTLGVQGDIVYTKLNKLLLSDRYSVVLSHRPEQFEQYVVAGADLVLTGHAHGGQIRIPFIGGLIAPHQGLFPNYTEGVYHQGKTDMVVSRGLGNSILPVRINNMPELVMITLKRK